MPISPVRVDTCVAKYINRGSESIIDGSGRYHRPNDDDGAKADQKSGWLVKVESGIMGGKGRTDTILNNLDPVM